MTLKGCVTQPQVGGAGTGPTSVRTSNLISGGGAWPINGTAINTMNVSAAKKRQGFDMLWPLQLDTAKWHFGLCWKALHDACRRWSDKSGASVGISSSATDRIEIGIPTPVARRFRLRQGSGGPPSL